MSTPSDPLDVPDWGGLALGIRLNLIEAGTTEADVKRDPAKLAQLKKAYRYLDALGVGKVNGRYVDTPRGLQKKLAQAAANEAERRASGRMSKPADTANDESSRPHLHHHTARRSRI